MLDIITDTLQPVIVELLLALALSAIAWLNRRLPERMRLDVEARHREALHSALETGTAYALDALGDALRLNPALATADATIGRIITYTQGSVPDALRHFVPTREQLEKMVRAKITEALSRHRPDPLSADPLAAALRNAGLPADEPGRG